MDVVFDVYLCKTLKLLAFFLRNLRMLSQQFFALYHSSQRKKNE